MTIRSICNCKEHYPRSWNLPTIKEGYYMLSQLPMKYVYEMFISSYRVVIIMCMVKGRWLVSILDVVSKFQQIFT